MTWVAAAVIGGAVIGGVVQSNAASKAARAQENAAATAAQTQRDIFNQITGMQAPYRGAGYEALNTLRSMMPGQYTTYDAQGNPIGTATGSGQLTHMFTAQDLNANLAPNYEFMLQQGLGAARQSANVGGGGSNVLKSGITFAENYAKNAYQQALENYTGQQQNIYNRLSGIANMGQTAAGATGTAGTQFANAAGQLGIGAATAYGAGQVGQANAISNMFSNIPGAVAYYNANQGLNYITPTAQPVTGG